VKGHPSDRHSNRRGEQHSSAMQVEGT